MAKLALIIIGLSATIIGGTALAQQQQEKVYRICYNPVANECRVTDERCAPGEMDPGATAPNKVGLCRSINLKTDSYYDNKCPKRPVPGC